MQRQNRKRKKQTETLDTIAENSSPMRTQRRSERTHVKFQDKTYEYQPVVATRKSRPFSIFAQRTDQSKMTTNALGFATPRRSSATIDPKKMLGMDTPAQQQVLKEFEKLHDRPAGEIITDEKGSAIAIKSAETKRTMPLRFTLGPINIYTNDQPIAAKPLVKELNKSSKHFQKFIQSTQYAAIKEFHEAFKAQELQITAEQQDNVTREKIAAGNRRIRSQNKTVAKSKKGAEKNAGATSYALASELFQEAESKSVTPTKKPRKKAKQKIDVQKMKWEWLHLIAYSIIGKTGQTPENLAAGRDHANTVMMFPEAVVKKLAKSYPKGFTLKVKANVIPGTHLATTFEYVIITKDFTIPFIINAQEQQKPLYIFMQYLNSMIKGLIARYTGIDSSDDKENIAAPVENKPSIVRQLFFSGSMRSDESVEQNISKKTIKPT